MIDNLYHFSLQYSEEQRSNACKQLAKGCYSSMQQALIMLYGRKEQKIK